MKRFFSSLAVALLVIPLLAQNPDFVLKYQQAKSLYDKGQYEQARTSIRNTLKKMPSLSADQKNMGNRLASQCDAAISNRDRLHVSSHDIRLGFQSSVDSIGCDAGKPNLITVTSSEPGWCKVQGYRNGYIFIKSEFNPDKIDRHATLTVKMGKIKSTSINVIQEARPDTKKSIVVRTTPDNARISIDGDEASVGVWQGSLPSGSHRFRIEKNGYAVKDTLVTVADDMKEDQLVELNLKLTPQFARLYVDVQPEEGFRFGEGSPSIILNGVIVDLNPREVYSYNDDRDVQRYALYDDGSIPVYPGRLDIQIRADSYESQRFDRQIRSGEDVRISRVMKPVIGYLTLDDQENAWDAIVSVDGVEMGPVSSFARKKIIVGEHLLTLQKEGFLSAEDNYSFRIAENESLSIPVKMIRYTPYVFTSTPAGARVALDGEYIGTTPTEPYILKEKTPGQSYQVELLKEGYFTEVRTITPDFRFPEVETEEFKLYKASKLNIEADIVDAVVTIKERNYGDSIFVKDVKLPAEVALPIREKPYFVEIRRIGDTKKVYGKKFQFDGKDKDYLKIQTYSRHSVNVLSANYLLGGMPPVSISSKEYKNMGNVSLLKFRLFPGLSTSAVRSGFFMGSDSSMPVVIGAGEDMETISSGNFNYIPALSVLMINGEFRLGGYITDYMQINGVATYAYYPDVLKHFCPFSHIVGHDVFVGAEISSHIRVINLNLKAGLQMYPGGLTANIYDTSKSNSRNDVIDRFYSFPIEGLPPTQFVISVGISLGGKDSKGENTLRLFHLF